MDGLTTRITPEFVDRWGRRLVVLLLGAGTVLTVATAYLAPAWLFYVPGVLAGSIGLAYLVRRPLVHLVVVLGGFVLISGHEPGLQAKEILYGLYYLTYLSLWFLHRFLTAPGTLIERTEDKAVAVFLVYATATAALTVLFGGSLRQFAGEWLSLSMLGFYWPVKHYCKTDRRATVYLVGVIVWFALYGTVRNLLFFREALGSAEQLWQILRSRVKLNEIFFMGGCMTGVVGTLYATRWKYRLGSATVFTISFASLIVTRSRGYWAAFAMGILVILVLVDARRKMYTLTAAGVGLTGFILVGYLLFPSYFDMVIASLLHRLSTYKTAFTRDTSLINRMYETKAVLWNWLKNPVLGYGMGTPFQYFNILPTRRFTLEGTFIHNGYAALLYKFGLVGFVSMAVFYLKGVWNGFRLFRDRNDLRLAQMIGLISVSYLVAEMLVANTSNPFIMSDGNLMIALMIGLATGTRAADWNS